LPSQRDLDSSSIETVAILSGDGTISNLYTKLAKWSGAILVLPGGTMNLLSRRLHGDVSLAALLEALRTGTLVPKPIPLIAVSDQHILTGLTVGPSTRWAEVREGMRHADLQSLAETIPAAWSETLSDQGVWVGEDTENQFASLFVEPVDGDHLCVIAFVASNIGDMVGHGLAWLRKDFRDGPHIDLGIMRDVTISAKGNTASVLIDGEATELPVPIHCRAEMSEVHFLVHKQ
jgi:diacylglycerol kinase family enzyme